MADSPDSFMAMFRRDAEKNLTKAGIYFVSQLRTELNVAQPYTRSPAGNYHGRNPSAPGNFPHKLSGGLQKSITWKLDKPNLVLTVGSNLGGYPKFLQLGTKSMQPRPWLTLSWGRHEAKITSIVTGK